MNTPNAKMTRSELRDLVRQRRLHTEVENLILEACHAAGYQADDFLAVPLAKRIIAAVSRDLTKRPLRRS